MNKPKRVLLYGFGPYRQFRDNITARIIKSLPRQAGLKKIVFPVRFQRKQFVEALARFKPDIVLGLGQSARRRIDVESQAINRRRARRENRPKPISASGPQRLKTTLPLKVGNQAGKSTSAGDYVCNFSMYVMLEEIQRAGAKTRFGFMHIPHDITLPKAARVVAGVLKELALRSGIAIAKSKPGSKAGAPSPT